MTRRYYIEKTLSLNSPILWTDSVLGQNPPAGSSTTQAFTDTNAPNRFYRVRAIASVSLIVAAEVTTWNVASESATTLLVDLPHLLSNANKRPPIAEQCHLP